MSATDTVCRQLDILQLVPRLPQRITAREILAQLPKTEHDVSLRTVQRDLDALSRKFPLTCDTEGRAQHWYWAPSAEQVSIPRMTASMAATLRLARDYLRPVLPGAVLSELDPLFAHADGVLDGTRLDGWEEKVHLLDRGPQLIPPDVDGEVREAVYRALLDDRRLKVSYRARDRDHHKEYVVDPLGLVVKAGVFYLVVTFDGYDDIRQLALHRMNAAEVLAEPASGPDGFSLKRYIEDDAGFSYPLSPEKIRVELVFEAEAGRHLTEVKLAEDQEVERLEDGRLRVTATVADTDELRWWLRGFGGAVEVRSRLTNL